MSEKELVDYLMEFSLTRQEASIYLCLLTEGKLTGYEVSKQTGISRSNAYSALANLVDKGAAYVTEEGAKKYTPVSVDEFCENYIHRLEEDKKWIHNHLPYRKNDDEGYITVEGQSNILNKIRNLLEHTKERVYISCDCIYLEDILCYIEKLLEKNVKVVIITDQKFSLKGATVYQSEKKEHQIGIIIDSKYVLCGDYGIGSTNNCLYSGQQNFVEVFKNAMSNEIKLISYTKGEH